MMITVTQTPGLLKVGDSAAAQKFVDQLKSTAAPQAQAQLLTQLQLLEDSSLAPPARLDVLELLREPIVTTQESRVREFAGKPVPFDDETRDVFTRTITLWQTVANAYESLITAMAEDGSPLAAKADVVCYRALRAVHQAFAAFRRAYHEPTPALWQQLHRLYAFAESAHVTAVPFAEKTVTESTAGLLYLQVVLAQKVQPDALSQTQMNILDRILDKWGILGLIASEPPQVQPDKLLTVDLDSGTGAHLGQVDSRSSRRYLLIDAVGEQLREAALGLKKSSPDKLGLGPVPRDACEKLLLSAYTQWFAPGSGRVDERKPASFNVMVSNTLSAIHYNLSGKPFTSPDTGLSSRAKFDLAGFERVDGPAVGEASGRSRELETWTVANQSASGVLGMCRNPNGATRLSYNQLLGLVAPNGNAYIGFVQRLSVDPAGATSLGFRLLRAKPETAAARIADIHNPYDRALLVPAVADKEPATIILPAGSYRPGGIVDLHVDGLTRQIKLTGLFDNGCNFDRATYTKP